MPLRLCILTDIISPYRIPVFNALASFGGVDLQVLFLRETEQRRSWAVDLGKLQFQYTVLSGFEVPLGGRDWCINWGVRKYLAHNRFDVIFCGGYNHLAAFTALFQAKRVGAKFVLWCESNERDERPRWRWIHYLKKVFIDRCDAFLVPGIASAEYLQGFGVSDDLIFTAPNAVDNDHFQQHSKVTKEYLSQMKLQKGYPDTLLLYVGRLDRSKGIFDLVRCFENLPEKDEVGLIIVGDGPMGAELKQYCRERGLKNVYLEGFVQQDELPNYYGLADVFVFPSYSDPWGLVVNEAMACALPIVSSDAPGVTDDLVRDGFNGFVYPAGDQQRLLDCIERLIRDPGLREKMGKTSKEIIQQYSPEKCANGFVEASERLMHLESRQGRSSGFRQGV